MPWLQLKIETGKADAERIEEILESVGAGAVMLEDAADQPLFEPPLGTTPLWDATRVVALFTPDSEMDAILEYVAAELGQPLPPHRVEILEDQVWERAWMDHYHPMCFGDRLWVVPSWTPPPRPDAINLLLDPGLAFGTGTHATTALCMEWLDKLDLQGKTVIDYGCGSGILAVAALLLGARQAWCVDIDPQALQATRDNAERNGVADRLTTYFPDDMPHVEADVVVANILAGPLAELAPVLAQLTTKNGDLAVSGIITTQVEDLQKAYSPWFSLDTLQTKEENWCRLSGKRHADR
ncbi:[LSU ribosomal protein L11P]-lysine N-methyltransferase [Fluviicoccus keumensis]|uniref:Ribosomal protein L11 methyltransferase n=1 Tax=Fluviicoccus keumensis TaxID=1435465 RepID=A0A4Q7YI88_9GAMM|nr:50S ribosomal protein L11 methyltransferase [Fluviicoccus keumensis]RZU36838.1 [LSU ribosomal protein L11P]-lysine N-methyltransferase [Fluviicoccus keumensis]